MMFAGPSYCRKKDFSGNRLCNGSLNGPTAFPGVLHNASIVRERWVLRQSHGGQVEQPGTHHTATPPHLSDVCKIEVVAHVFVQLIGVGATKNVESFGIGLHETVFDAVVNHLDEVSRPGRSAV